MGQRQSIKQAVSNKKDLIINLVLVAGIIAFLLLFIIAIYREYKKSKSEKQQQNLDVESAGELTLIDDNKAVSATALTPPHPALLRPAITQTALSDSETVVSSSSSDQRHVQLQLQPDIITDNGQRRHSYNIRETLRRFFGGGAEDNSRADTVTESVAIPASVEPEAIELTTTGISSLLEDTAFEPIRVVHSSDSEDRPAPSETQPLTIVSPQPLTPGVPEILELSTVFTLASAATHTPLKTTYTLEQLLESSGRERIDAFIMTGHLPPFSPTVDDSSFDAVNMELIDIAETLQQCKDHNPTIGDPTSLLRLQILRVLSGVSAKGRYQNARLFTPAFYRIIQLVVNELIVVVGTTSALLEAWCNETIFGYCKDCWDYDDTPHREVDTTFSRWGQTPLVASRVQVYQFLLRMLFYGKRREKVVEILRHFSFDADPEIAEVLQEEEESTTNSERLQILRSLKRICAAASLGRSVNTLTANQNSIHGRRTLPGSIHRHRSTRSTNSARDAYR